MNLFYIYMFCAILHSPYLPCVCVYVCFTPNKGIFFKEAFTATFQSAFLGQDTGIQKKTSWKKYVCVCDCVCINSCTVPTWGRISYMTGLLGRYGDIYCCSTYVNGRLGWRSEINQGLSPFVFHSSFLECADSKAPVQTNNSLLCTVEEQLSQMPVSHPHLHHLSVSQWLSQMQIPLAHLIAAHDSQCY